MQNLKRMLATTLFSITVISAKAVSQQAEPQMGLTLATGTLNIILANKHGFVIASDSRMSSESPFQCDGKAQLHCDNSQKLFRTSTHSALVIAGFAVGRSQTPTPLDLEVAPVLRRVLESTNPTDEQSSEVPGGVEVALADTLTGVAALYDPSTPAWKLGLTATFARLDSNHVPVLQQIQFTETWTPMGPQRVLAPSYNPNLSQPFPVTRFIAVPVGITCVADLILAGHYNSEDPVIRSYYQRRKNNQLDDMQLSDMTSLARVILRETRKFTDLVGGEDQIGEVPSDGEPNFKPVKNLPTETKSVTRTMRWQGLTCSDAQTPPCGNPPLSFSFGPAQSSGEFTKFLMGSEFKNIPVVLDGNLLIADNFDGVTLKWRGRPFVSYRNAFKNCILELTVSEQELQQHPDLLACRVVHKERLDLPVNTVGLPINTFIGGGGFGLPRDLRP